MTRGLQPGAGWLRGTCGLAARAGIGLVAIALLAGGAGCAGRPKHVEHGIASYHAPFFLSREAKTASGERWLNFKLVAAHKSLPFGTKVRVVNLENGRSVKVRIIDRGPYVAGRIIDVSGRAASKLGMRQQGVVRVRIEVVEWP